MSPLTVEQLLSAHPWPAEYASAPRKEWLWNFDIDLPVEKLWPLIADSSRMNRALGVQEMKFEDRGNERWGTSAPLGLTQEWLEVPWSWVTGQWLESVRVYRRGFAKVMYGVFVLTPLEVQRTRVTVYFGAVPRGLFGKLMISLGLPTLEKDFRRVFREVAHQVAALQPVFVLPPREPLPPDASARLGSIRTTLVEQGLDAALVDRLVEWVRTGDEVDLARIQVRERARAWKVNEQDLLRVALHATRAGLLQISWDLVCPHCRGPAGKAETLGALKAQGRCEVCEIDFGSDAPESVEITFHPHSSVRPITVHTFCSAEPAKKEHIRVQRELKPGEAITLEPSLGPGRWRLRTHGSKQYGFLDTGTVAAASLEWRATATPKLEGPERPPLTLVNDSAEPRRFIVEAAGWSDFALRPAQLFSLQEYRDLFSEDYLGADVQLAVGEQTVLFTDIVGSTAMYAKRGDPAAFTEVKRHFDEVFPLVARHRGAVVKTIGDAVMAAFIDPLDAVQASAAIHGAFHRDRADSPTRLRISLNTGPCIAVKLNAGIDYFGQTVNLAAKLQSLAEAGEVALSESVWRARGVQEFLAGAVLEDVAYESKALAAPVPVKRWKCY